MKNKQGELKLIDAVEGGKTISPVLPDEIKNYMIDIDGTICDDIPNEEPERMATAGLYNDALETINTWYDQGHIITFFTSRIEEHRQVTEDWLKDNGIQLPRFTDGQTTWWKLPLDRQSYCKSNAIYRQVHEPSGKKVQTFKFLKNKR